MPDTIYETPTISSEGNSSGIVSEIPSDIKRLLLSLHKLSATPDWSESLAQELAAWGAELHNKYAGQ